MTALRLTPREHQVAALVVQGLSDKAIAEELGCAFYTVRTHVHNILSKNQLTGRVDLAVQYTLWQMWEPPT